MVKKCATLFALIFVASLVPIPDAAPSITTFIASTGGSANFTGNSSKFLQVTNDSTTAMSMSADFTISWWQKSIETQTAYPRILQFGHGHEYQNKFAISEEIDGNIHLWINGMIITSIPNPNPGNSNWNHIAITRDGFDYSWFLNGVFVKTTYFDFIIPEGALSKWAEYDTSGLDLLIGSGDDAENGGFTGNLAGVQISQSVRWDVVSSFTPPTNFQNPGPDLAFSMYVSESAVIDKSGNNLLVVPIVTSYGELADDFNPSNSTPPPPTEVLPSVFESWGQGWNSLYGISKGEVFPAPYDYRQIKTISIGIPLTFTDAGGQLRKTKCHIDIAGKWTSDASKIRIQLGDFDLLARYQFPDQCQTGAGYSVIPDYTPGLFGTDKIALDFVIWTETITAITDLADVNSAYEKFSHVIDLPPEITSYSIARGENPETETDRISFGDTLTVTVWNETATAYVAMRFHIPEARYESEDNSGDHWCIYEFEEINSDGIYALPSLQELLDECRIEYDGTWEYDQTIDRSFEMLVGDSGGAVGNKSTLTLNALPGIDWSLYPSSVGRYDFFWGITATFNNDIGDPQYDYSNIKHVSIGLPISYTDSTSATVNVLCHFPLPDEFIYGDARNLEVVIPEFSVITNNLDLICGFEIPSYTHGMLGETQTDLTFYLWTQTEVADYELTSSAFEAVPVTLDLPPEVSGYTITRGSSSETDNSKIYSGDTLTVSIINQDAMHTLEFTIAAPESKQVGVEADPLNSCYFLISADSSGVIPTSFLIPTAEEISTNCHIEWNDAWTYDLTADRLVSINATDLENNGFIFNGPTLMGTPAPTPPAPTPPAPTPPAPTPPAPTPPTPTPTPEVEPPVEQVKSIVEKVDLALDESQLPLVAKPIKSEIKSKRCSAKGVWVFTKSGLLQICDAKLNVLLAVKACAGKSANPTFPWIFKAQRFKPGYSQTKSGQKLYYSVFFYKGLAIAGVDKVASAPCSNGSVFIDKRYSKQVYGFIKQNNPVIWVKES
ncbi:hypothetical protein MCEMRE26_01451 [Candidatus Nanopelagicaceae bacterium]